MNLLGSLPVFAKVFEVFWVFYNSNDATEKCLNKSEVLKKKEEEEEILTAIQFQYRLFSSPKLVVISCLNE